MLAVVPTVICLVAAVFLRKTVPEEDKGETQLLNAFNVIAIVLASYLLAFDISGSHGHVLSVAFAIGLIVLLGLPLGVPFYLGMSGSKPNSDIERAIKQPLIAPPTRQADLVTVTKTVALGSVQAKRQPLIGEDHSILETVKTVDFWILFVSFLCGVGTGLCFMNNMGQMGLALGYTDVSIFISLTSIWGFFGRIISGLVSEHYIWKQGTPRPIWNAASQILMTLGYIIMALALPGSFFIGSILVGICYGVRLTVTVPIASELFGLKYYGLLYNILILNLPLGSFLFSGLLAGYLYDVQATISSGGSNTCVGPQCYMLVFVIMGMVCVFGFGLDVLLTFRTKNIYSRMCAEHKFKARMADENYPASSKS